MGFNCNFSLQSKVFILRYHCGLSQNHVEILRGYAFQYLIVIFQEATKIKTKRRPKFSDNKPLNDSPWIMEKLLALRNTTETGDILQKT